MKEKIIYIHPQKSSFTEKDINILSGSYSVVTPGHNWSVKRMTPLNFLRQFCFLARHLHAARAVFVMFGGYWSFLPALLGKITRTPVYIIPGGTDSVSFPSLRYGSLRKPLLRTFIRWSFGLCSELLPVDETLVISDYSYHESGDYPKQGYMYFFPGLTTPYRVIHNGFDPDCFSGDLSKKKKNTFIVLAPVNSMTRVKVKGIDLVLYLAENFAHCSFTLVGIDEDITHCLGEIPSNVIIHPYLEKEQFSIFLEESQFVLQLSVSEGFPNALCEAMLYCCIPVGSSVGAIPQIIGDTGFVIQRSGKEYLSRIFDEILSTDSLVRDTMAVRARERIVKNFHISYRERALLTLLDPVTGK